MKSGQSLPQQWNSKPTRYPARVKWLRRMDATSQVIGSTVIVIGHGLRRSGIIPWELGVVPILVMLFISVSTLMRFRWSLAQQSFAKRNLWTVVAAAAWSLGLVAVLIIGPILPDTNGDGLGGSRWWGLVHLSEFVLILYSLTGAIRGLRKFASGGVNPAFLLVASFLMLITVGTIMLMLPACRAFPPQVELEGAPFLVAFFTATSASCVTGLIVVDTPTYWSPIGQFVIMCLFQIGGLGIMTFSAFFAVIAGRNVRLSEFATLRDLLSSDGVGDIRRLIYAILGFTFAAELIGAILLWPMFADLPLSQQIFMSLFHSISAFCNAGFALTDNSFVGMGNTWCVGGVITALIITGGLGFSVLYNLATFARTEFKRFTGSRLFYVPRQRRRLRLETKLVLTSTIVLLLGGWAMIYLLERTGPGHESGISLADAWFQSVTFRTAGFNTVDLGELQPSTKLIAIFLMIVGASPGSTGGGIKTIVFAVGAVGLLTVIRGRRKVEAFRRTISETTVNRALAIVFTSLLTVMVTTILIVIFEGRPELFLDHLFEATSAVGTVGVSSTVQLDTNEFASTTFSLTAPSRIVVIVAMFLGRIGPLTLLLALAGEGRQTRYEYPTERVTLG
ncbi:TrkH family potassium uptake protein [Thalassoglobus polymorphus]|uniref:Ktr system potassium uptake protein B n=1 Tax=Thalassoglobus polymorphus TaxID=2527994 RepID=A0A517QUD8_9PLAN|nr:potassium transporter TrkG [Thalassoglobus polymorphus]QDT35223.1 Ktr system potassium uptake protein B [Thalassoglobus polymorphus]